VTGEWLSQGIKEYGHKEVLFSPGQEDTLSILLSIVKPGDLIITLGAGDIYGLAGKLLDKLD
jgi:UDP-N-acetylmuramate--alanine ligase